MPSETDPLLPAYSQSPEISGHNQHRNQSSEIYYGDPGLARAHTEPEPWNKYDGYQSYRADDVDPEEGDNEDARTTIENGMARFFRGAFVVIFFGAFFALVVSFLNSRTEDADRPWGPWPVPSKPNTPSNSTIDERVKAILTSTPLIDGHDDLAIFLRGQYQNNITSDKFKSDWENGTMRYNVDVPRLRKGMSGGAFWSAWVMCPFNASYDMTDQNYATAASHTLQQIDLLKRLQAQYPRIFTPATSPSPGQDSGRSRMLAQFHATRALFAPISIEGLHQILPGSPMSTLRTYYDLGVRMATLTWNCHNPFADAALINNDFVSPPIVVNGPFRPKEGAVTDLGKRVIKEMNRLGMIVDISHTSYWTQKEILSGVSRAPVVYSHSSAYALCPHPRNVRDDLLELVKNTNSLVMVNFSPNFISCVPKDNSNSDDAVTGKPHFELPEFYEKNNTLHQVAKHIKYIGDRIGYAYVGMGSDFDGMGDLTPRGLDGVDKFPDLVAELLEMGVSDKDAESVVGGNLLRVWKDVDDIAMKMQKEGVLPGVDDSSGY